MLGPGIRKITKKNNVFCSIANQEPLKATGDFIFHQAVFKVSLVLYLFLHCGTYMQFCLIASKCTVASLSLPLSIHCFILRWVISWEKNVFWIVYMKSMSTVNFTFAPLPCFLFSWSQKCWVLNAVEYCNLYSIRNDFSHQIFFYVTNMVCHLSPKCT